MIEFTPRKWTPEEIAAEEARRNESVQKGICPDSGEPLIFDNPLSDAPQGTRSCEMCDCFGYPPR